LRGRGVFPAVGDGPGVRRVGETLGAGLLPSLADALGVGEREVDADLVGRGASVGGAADDAVAVADGARDDTTIGVVVAFAAGLATSTDPKPRTTAAIITPAISPAPPATASERVDERRWICGAIRAAATPGRKEAWLGGGRRSHSLHIPGSPAARARTFAQSASGRKFADVSRTTTETGVTPIDSTS
jgi:hypothetical protein